MKQEENDIIALRLPSDALNFDQDLFSRAQESVQQSSLLPLLKDELRCKIQTKRLSQGLAELKVDFQVKPPSPLTEEERSKQDSRKINNRVSAKRCRLKKKIVQSKKQQELRKLMEQNTELKEKIRLMENQKEYYLSNIVQHPVIKNVLLEFCETKTEHTEVLSRETQLLNRQIRSLKANKERKK